MNEELLRKIKIAGAKNFDAYAQKVLEASANHGAFGMDMVDMLHDQLPRTSCGNCGKCCNSISMYSLEYHRVMREVMARWKPERVLRLIKSLLRFDLRQAQVGSETRLRCVFRDDETKVCLVHPVRPFACRIFGLLKENGQRECDNVKDLSLPEQTVKEEYLINLQAKILENSESFEPFEGKGEIHFFPFEFWFFRYLFSPERALQIYREILVPLSTPLTKMWEKQEQLPDILPSDYES
ncbi:MAG: YkgJ family cysteine cluster protein [Candidatus Riflebacteria bacterium]|nr:YkgJ family cysteine cluster protein [Candidatus Riflebacteria bacterium]MBR4570600.1 YkgJ family cysteine cluster protein [Candidatus Riflebacteria bacterium]